jgi:hypothetical protein
MIRRRGGILRAAQSVWLVRVDEMANKRLISEGLADTVVQRLATLAALDQRAMTIEFQDDFQFLLIGIPCERVRELSQDERRQLGLEFDRLMPKRQGELTWMLNFAVDGKVVDSYFGGDSTSPELGF